MGGSKCHTCTIRLSHLDISQSVKPIKQGHLEKFINSFPLILLNVPLMYTLKMNIYKLVQVASSAHRRETLLKASGWTRVV